MARLIYITHVCIMYSYNIILISRDFSADVVELEGNKKNMQEESFIKSVIFRPEIYNMPSFTA